MDWVLVPAPTFRGAANVIGGDADLLDRFPASGLVCVLAMAV